MVWTEPKEDWKMGDAPSNTDFNRIEKNTKHIFDMIGAVGGIATLGQDGKVPREQLPAAVEIKTIRIPSTSIPVGGSVSRTVTFDYYHKAAIVGAMNKQDWLLGFVGVVINASEGISDTPGIFSVTEYTGGMTQTYISGNRLNGNIFGDKIGFELSFANKIFTFTLKKVEGSSAADGQADVNIIAL
jgi:hypothetical protein